MGITAIIRKEKEKESVLGRLEAGRKPVNISHEKETKTIKSIRDNR